MPATPGDYELRLCEADSPYKTLVAKPIKLIGRQRHRERARHGRGRRARSK